MESLQKKDFIIREKITDSVDQEIQSFQKKKEQREGKKMPHVSEFSAHSFCEELELMIKEVCHKDIMSRKTRGDWRDEQMEINSWIEKVEKFKNRQQLKQLCKYLLSSRIKQANLQYCLELLFNSLQKNQFQDCFLALQSYGYEFNEPFFKICQMFRQLTAKDSIQSSFRSQGVTSPNSQLEKGDSDSIPEISLQRVKSQANESKLQRERKQLKAKGEYFDSFVQILSTGNLEHANVFLAEKQSYRKYSEYFGKQIGILKALIEYLNEQYFSDDRLQVQGKLCILQDCTTKLQSVREIQKSQINNQATRSGLSETSSGNRQRQIDPSRFESTSRIQILKVYANDSATQESSDNLSHTEKKFGRVESATNLQSRNMAEEKFTQQTHALQKQFKACQRDNRLLKKEIQDLKRDLKDHQNVNIENDKTQEIANLKKAHQAETEQNLNFIEALKTKVRQCQEQFASLEATNCSQQAELQNSKLYYESRIGELEEVVLLHSETIQRLKMSLESEKQYSCRLAEQIQRNEARSVEKLKELEGQYLEEQKSLKELLLEKSVASMMENSKILTAHSDFKAKSLIFNEIRNSYSEEVSHFEMLFKYDANIKMNFHTFCDKKPNLLVLVQLQSGTVVGAYSHEPLSKDAPSRKGFLFSLSEGVVYRQKEASNAESNTANSLSKNGTGQSPKIINVLTYDEYYLIVGNSELRIKLGDDVCFSNFGINNSLFDSKGQKIRDFYLNTGEREEPFKNFEIFTAHFKDGHHTHSH